MVAVAVPDICVPEALHKYRLKTLLCCMEPDGSLTWNGIAMVEPLPYGPASIAPMVIVCAITGVNANESSMSSESKLFVKVLFM